MFDLFLALLKKVVKKGECYFLKKGGEVGVGGDRLERDGLKFRELLILFSKILSKPYST